MTAPDPLTDLKQRLAAAEAERQRQKNRGAEAADDDAEAAATSGKAGRLVVEFSVPIIACTALGLWLDRRLETLPWLTLIFVLLGFGAAIMNVFRLAGGYGAVGYRRPQTPVPPPDHTTDEDKTPRE